MEVRVKCDFPYIKVMGNIKESDNCVTFRGINGDTFQYTDRNGEQKETGMFVFNAFGEMKERIKKLKIQKGSEISVGAYMTKFYKKDDNGQQYANYSFNVYAVDFLPSRIRKSNGEKDEEEPKKKAQPTPEPVKVVKNNSPENVDISDLERMFG